MQMQNQHLLQQVTERDDYNIKVSVKIFVAFFPPHYYQIYWCGGMVAHCPWFLNDVFGLVSESVKTKQAQSFVLSDKQALVKQLQQVNTSLESLNMRVSYGEEQVW